MKRLGTLWALSLLLFSSLAAASGDGCDQWCGELPSAYFLAPMNDTRSNVGLLLEDLGQLAYAPKSLPFHYGEFIGEASDSGEAQAGESTLGSLAQELGIGPDAVSQALGRQGGGGFGRCLSDNGEGVEAFFRALKASALPAADALALATERLRFLGLCQNALADFQPLQVSEKARPHAQYLEAAAAFYAGQFDRALPLFQSLSASTDGWPRETSMYLLGRVALNQAQARFDDWSAPGPENIDRPSLDRAAAAFGDYLKAYPTGIYAASAKGLFRKLHWLASDHAALATDYQRWLESGLGTVEDQQLALAFIQETESKQNPAGAQLDGLWPAPVLAAAKILSSWRSDGDPPKDPVGKDLIAAHGGAFAGAKLEGTDAYLQLARTYWVDRDYGGVIQATASDQVLEKASNRIFSRSVLRGLALLATGRTQDAETLWLEIVKTDRHPGHQRQAQWLLALTLAGSGRLDSVYAQDTAVGEAEIQEFFVHQASPAQLESLSQRQDLPPRVRSLAYYDLVNGQLRHREFKAATQLLAAHDPAGYSLGQDKLAPLSWAGHADDGYACPPLKELLVLLQKSPIATHSLNCMGDFLRTQDWDGGPAVIADQEYADEGTHRWHYLSDYGLAAKQPTAGRFVGDVSTSLDYYREVIERSGKGGGKDVAYALHRATNCFASSGNNHCGAQDIPKETRAAWFKRLKSEFKQTSWAKEQKYYW